MLFHKPLIRTIVAVGLAAASLAALAQARPVKPIIMIVAPALALAQTGPL